MGTAVYVGTEVKTLKDRFSVYQHEFMVNLIKAGGIGLVATEDKRTGNMIILDYYDYINKPGRSGMGDYG